MMDHLLQRFVHLQSNIGRSLYRLTTLRQQGQDLEDAAALLSVALLLEKRKRANKD